MVLENEYVRFGISATFVDSSDLANVQAAIRPNTKLVYIETPANPTLKLADIAGLRRDRPRGRRPAVRRQHLRLAVPAEPAATWAPTSCCTA